MPWGRIKRDRMPRLGCLVREPFFFFLSLFVCVYLYDVHGSPVSTYQIELNRSEHLGLGVFMSIA